MRLNEKNKIDQELRKQTIPYIKRLHELFGGRQQICSFLDCEYHHMTKCVAGQSVLRPREARMIEHATSGEVTFRQLRPDLFFTPEKIQAECEAGFKRYKEYIYKPPESPPMLNRINADG